MRLGFGKVGLGPNGWGPIRYLFPYNKRFYNASKAHDVGYSRGVSESDRYRTDTMFYRLMLAVSKNRIQLVFAKLYYNLVREFGWMYFKYR